MIVVIIIVSVVRGARTIMIITISIVHGRNEVVTNCYTLNVYM